MMFRCFPFALTLVLLLTVGNVAAAQALDPLDVPQGGDLPGPPLTQQVADNFAGTLMWVLDAPLTETQRQDLDDTLAETWAAHDTAAISTVTQLADVGARLATLGETSRIALRQQVQPGFVDQLRQASDPFSKWMLDIYDGAHRPIAAGNPALTRQVSDANAEVMYFLLKVVANGDGDMSGVKLDRGVLDAWAASLAADYPNYTPQQQQSMAQMPLFRAAAAEGWSTLPADERAQLREAWRPLAQDFLATASCDAFVGLAKGGMVEPTDANRARFSGCSGSTASAAPGEASAGHPLTSTELNTIGANAYQQAMNEIQSRHNTYVGLSNMMMSNHVTMMNAINNIGNSPYTYVLH